MQDSKQFMMIFRFQPNAEYQPTEAEMNESQQQWGAFIGKLAIKEKLVSTHQLGFEGVKISADLSVAEGITVAEGNTIGGNMVVVANNLEEATEMAKDCPILKMGGTVEVRSITPM